MTSDSGSEYASMSDAELQAAARERGLAVSEGTAREELVRQLEEEGENEDTSVRGSGIIGGTDGYGTGVPALGTRGQSEVLSDSGAESASTPSRAAE